MALFTHYLDPIGLLFKKKVQNSIQRVQRITPHSHHKGIQSIFIQYSRDTPHSTLDQSSHPWQSLRGGKHDHRLEAAHRSLNRTPKLTPCRGGKKCRFTLYSSTVVKHKRGVPGFIHYAFPLPLEPGQVQIHRHTWTVACMHFCPKESVGGFATWREIFERGRLCTKPGLWRPYIE